MAGLLLSVHSKGQKKKSDSLDFYIIIYGLATLSFIILDLWICIRASSSIIILGQAYQLITGCPPSGAKMSSSLFSYCGFGPFYLYALKLHVCYWDKLPDYTRC